MTYSSINDANTLLLKVMPFLNERRGYSFIYSTNMVDLQLNYDLPKDNVSCKNGLIVTRNYTTAYVGFNAQGKNITFKFNKYFAETLNIFELTFVFAHEALHVVFDHGRRGKDFLEKLPPKKRSRKLLNIAMDICINEILLEQVFSEKKEFMPLLEDMCFISTIFKSDADMIERDKGFEYYYEEILKMLERNKKEEGCFDDNTMFGDALFDDEDDDGDGGLGEILDELQERAGNPKETECDGIFEGKTEKHDSSNEVRKKEQYISMRIQDAVDRFIKPRNMSVYDMDAVIKTKYSWTKTNRRTAALQDSQPKQHILIPNRQYIRKLKKMRVVIYCDVSGSVAKYTEQLLHMISGIDTDRCEVLSYVWADRVGKADYVGNGEYVWSKNVGSGTNIGEVLSHYVKEFPDDATDAVLVLTDGGYQKIRRRRLGSGFDDSKWIFFMTEDHYPEHILDKSTSVKIEW